ncbi:hypothetical protein BWQ96_03190 [Gracilariopsis chorda]|uniref:Uncharacterized protein n=1 Tax=Gracilariopsis chorda TaxID=448386 RepID=A0A2V3J0V3_9FLOR|nr:hypothetical protein BWQ96_03190 [Gracilariopsis chorda]|eukprot:PXF47000.1 hypothetical protein BWQ96_03190 [Gracilariopsis chorda]
MTNYGEKIEAKAHKMAMSIYGISATIKKRGEDRVVAGSFELRLKMLRQMTLPADELQRRLGSLIQ